MSDEKEKEERREVDYDHEYVILVEFAHKHLDFLMQELLSVLEMNGVIVERVISHPSQFPRSHLAAILDLHYLRRLIQPCPHNASNCWSALQLLLRIDACETNFCSKAHCTISRDVVLVALPSPGI